jgi:hypothetical protein
MPAAKSVAKPETKATKASPKEERSARSRQKFEEAKALILKELESGDWIPSKKIHEKLREKVSQGMVGRVKSELKIEHRRVKGDSGPETYYWKLPKGK